jgi:DNA-binding NtrC family response regulator
VATTEGDQPHGGAPGEPPVGADGFEVLAVDDNELLRQMCTMVLREWGFRTLVADNADDAMAALAANPGVAVVVTDLVMPGDVSGIELVEWLRSTRPDIGLVVTTGSSSHDFTPLPGEELLLKPFGVDDLVAAVRRVGPHRAHS